MPVARLIPTLRLACRLAPVVVNSSHRLYLCSSLTFSGPKASPIHTSTPQSYCPGSPILVKLCPSCSKPLSSPLPACTNCWNIFGLPSDVTHHELFGLPYEPNPFVIDLAFLKQRFRQAQAVCHPDTWTSKGLNKQDIAQALSAHVNEAYQALLRPLARAEYILSRNKLPISEHDQVSDTTFMVEIMESRELIDDAEESSEVVNLIDENDVKINDTIHQIEKLVGQKDWAAVKAAAIRLRYLEGIARAARKWLDNH